MADSLLAHVRRPYRLLTPFQTVNVAANCVTVGRASLSLVGSVRQSRHSSSKFPGSPTAGPCSRPSAAGDRPFLISGGTLKKPQTEPSRPHPQGPGKDTQMGENAKDEAAPFPLTDVDKWVLSQTDDEFTYHTWDELRQLIQNNQLERLKRKPSDLRRYIKWTAETKAEYGSITNFLLAHRLPRAWGPPPFKPASDTPFADPSDYRVLINDWPYGFAPGITHIVVWSRTPIATDDTVGDMTPESRRTVAEFIKRYFVDSLGPGGEDRVMWFKNWVALQSVRTVDHVHVLVKDVEPALLQEWAKEHEWHRAR